MPLPIGWENRSNRMSEKDMKLGGIASTHFVDRRLSNNLSNHSSTHTEASFASYSGGGVMSSVYENNSSSNNNNDSIVRENYLRQLDPQTLPTQSQHDASSPFSSGSRHGLTPSNSQHSSITATPLFWEERQQIRELEAEGFRSQDTLGKALGGVVTRPTPPEASSSTVVASSPPQAAAPIVVATPASTPVHPVSTSPSPPTSYSRVASSNTAHVALLKVATNALESLADVLEQDTFAELPMEDRSAFARAIQRSMQALTKAPSSNSSHHTTMTGGSSHHTPRASAASPSGSGTPTRRTPPPEVSPREARTRTRNKHRDPRLLGTGPLATKIRTTRIKDALARGGLPPIAFGKNGNGGSSTVERCLSWHLKGSCFADCPRVADHVVLGKEHEEGLYQWCKIAYDQ